MSNITIIFKDGERREFRHEGRAGGSFTKSAKTEEGWVIVTDEWDRESRFPASDVEEVKVEPHQHRW